MLERFCCMKIVGRVGDGRWRRRLASSKVSEKSKQWMRRGGHRCVRVVESGVRRRGTDERGDEDERRSELEAPLRGDEEGELC